MTRRARVILVSAALLVCGGAAAVVGGVLVATGTEWGHAQLLALVERQAAAALAPGVRLHIGRLDGSLRRSWVADSVVLTDSGGAVVFSARRLTAQVYLTQLFRGDVHLGAITIDGAHARLERNARGVWNFAALRSAKQTVAPSGSIRRQRFRVDSVDIRDGRVDLTLPGTIPSGPRVRRLVSGIHLVLGATTVDQSRSGGATEIRTLAFTMDNPDLTVVSARGSVRWWPDSLRLDMPSLRLPRSIASAKGTVAWRTAGSARVAVDVRADTIDLRDLRRLTTLVPAEGSASAVVAIRSGAGGAIGYDITAFDVRAAGSHITGALRVTPGTRTEVRDIAVAFNPLDLALVRATFGDSVLAPAWRGTLTGKVAARGGFLDSLEVDTIAATFTDARIGGAQSRLVASGAVDAAARPLRLFGVHVRVDSLQVRTLGAAALVADSLSGILTGDVTLDGTTQDLRFADLRVRHAEHGATSAAVAGSGRVAPDRKGHWLDADLVLDTLAVARLAAVARAGGALTLRGAPHGSVTLHAVADTLTVDATLIEGAATVRMAGTTLITPNRSRVALSGTVRNLDPRVFVTRADVPPARLTGTATISVDDTPSSVDRHVDLALDSTSKVGDSRLTMAEIRFGVDSTGFHVDTAEVHADAWRLSARGRLAADSTRSDTLWFDGKVDSLAALRSILLDGAGAPRFPDLAGRLTVNSGQLDGSFADAHLYASLTATDVRIGGDTIATASGAVDLDHLPHRATGALHGALTGVSSGAVTVDSALVTARVTDGERARLDVRAVASDSMVLTAAGDVTWPAGGYEGRLDSLLASVREHRWRLAAPAVVTVRAGVVSVDSAVFRSDHGASMVAAGSIPDRGPIHASLRVTSLGFEELAFLGILPGDLAGLITATADLSGTRDAPLISVTAALDSIRSDGLDRPSLTFGMQYARRNAAMQLAATIDARRVLDIHGNVPLDLSLHAVEQRILDAPLSLSLAADSVTLAAFDGLAPRLQGLAGYVDGAVEVGGTLRRPRGNGTLTLADGAFDLQRYGFAARRASADLRLAGDSVIVRHLRVGDADSPRDSATVVGVVHLAGQRWSEWQADLRSVANDFRVIDDPRVATAKADWNLTVSGALRAPSVTGNVVLPYGVFTIGKQRRARAVITDSLAGAPVGTPNAQGVVVALGSDVRLKSTEANVQLAGSVELFGSLNRPWISGSVQATRGTYRVDLGPLKRTFRVDSGSVILEGTSDVPPALDIYSSYTVRRPESDDVKIGAHLYGTTDRPRLDLSSDLGSAVSQSEIISYLVFGKPSFAVPQRTQAAAQTAYDAVVPSILGGYLEGLLSTVLPFFNTLQVTPVGRDDPRFSISNPIENLFNSFAVTGGRQIGSDTFLSITTGVCTGSSVSTTNSSPIWFGTSAEYRPKRTLGAAISIDPGPAPCSRVGSVGDAYQIGFDLLYDWRFGKRR